VWVGRQEGGSLPSWAYSGDVPTPVWQQAVAGTLAGRSRTTFAQPAGITSRVVRQVNMAFREAEADQEPVERDGSRRNAPVQVARPAPESAASPVPVAPSTQEPQTDLPAPVQQDLAPVPAAPEGGWTSEYVPGSDGGASDQPSAVPADSSGLGQQGDTDDQSDAVSPAPEQPAPPEEGEQVSGDPPTEDQLPELPALDPVR
jgi:hypothetical protein